MIKINILLFKQNVENELTNKGFKLQYLIINNFSLNWQYNEL
jgi:hypothetical protein